MISNARGLKEVNDNQFTNYADFKICFIYIYGDAFGNH